MSELGHWRLRAQIALHRHGHVPVIALALLLAGALAWAQVLSRHAEQRAQRGLAEVATAVPRASASVLPAWVAPAELNSRVRSLLQLAHSQGLEVGRVDYRWPDGEAQAHATRLEVGIPVRADYASIKRFMAAALLDSPAVSIDQLTLRRDNSPHSGRLEAMLWFSIWQSGVMNAASAP